MFGCSNSVYVKQTSEKEQEQVQVKPVEESFSTDGIDITIADTVNLKAEVTSQLELARQHYLAALESFENEDSLQSIKEFEDAIKILDELSYYPDIEKNEEFNELSKSLIEDYEKLIASIDELDSETSIFALREKINSEAELIDVKKEKIPIISNIPKTSVPLEINEKVEQFIAYFMDRGHKFLPKWFYKSGIYFPMMKRIFAEEGLPQELIYLSLIESGLNPTARSWASAVGLWQFIKKTGEKYGLNGNFWIDDRRNPEKATRAAAKHMKDLYDQYEDWHLVLAAYNCGAGRVNSALRRSKSSSYWDIWKHLPRETRGYVPQYIAISLIFMNPEQYGFGNMDIGKPVETENVMIKESIDFSVLAECAGSPEEELILMNPDLIHECTPPNYAYPLKIPKDKTAVFTSNLENIPSEKKRSFTFHVVKKGESASSISQKYNIPKDLLVSINNLDKLPRRRRNKSRIPVGLALKIPLRYNSSTLASLKKEPIITISDDDVADSQTGIKKEKQVNNLNKTKLTYIVQENEDLKTVSLLYDVRVSDLRNWNDIAFGEDVEESDSLEIWVPNSKLNEYKDIVNFYDVDKKKILDKKSKKSVEKEKRWITHKVSKGETLGSIASDFNLDVKSIKRWNKIKKNLVKTGQNIKIYTRVPLPELTENTKNEKSKEITYEVKDGDTPYSIAKKNNISLNDLQLWNNLDGKSIVKTGQILRLIPSATIDKKLVANSKTIDVEKIKNTKLDDYQTYKVNKGDNLFTIAKAYNVKVEDIKTWNNLEDNSIKKGQSLKIFGEQLSNSKGDNSRPKTSSKKENYKIRKGDNLYKIAKKFGCKLDDLKKWNNVTNNDLKIGNMLVIYR